MDARVALFWLFVSGLLFCLLHDKKTPAYKIQALATKNMGKGSIKSGGVVYAQEIAETVGKGLYEIRGALIQAQCEKWGYTIRGWSRGAYIACSDLVDFYNHYVEKILPDPVGEDQDLQTE